LSGNLLHSVEGGEGFGIWQIVKDGDRPYRNGVGRRQGRLRLTGEISNLIRMRQHGRNQALYRQPALLAYYHK
jgi:hypothetical protein